MKSTSLHRINIELLENVCGNKDNEELNKDFEPSKKSFIPPLKNHSYIFPGFQRIKKCKAQ